jgi:OPA family glycerol-3-phosphate transporter-like MFS transporter
LNARSVPGMRSAQISTVALLFAGYAGYYFCRSDLSVAMPLIIAELKSRGMEPGHAIVAMGSIASYGVLAYAAGKFLLTGIADFLGGRRNFLGGMAGAILFTVLFTLSGAIPMFTLAWIGNRFLQSGGWAGLVKVSSRWFDYSSYGTVMGILSISYLVGDAAARKIMGEMIRHGFGWRALFLFAAGFLFVIFALNWWFLRESRVEAGFSEPEVNPLNAFRKEGDLEKPPSIGALLGPLLKSPMFWLVCLLSLGCTLVRETFNTWTPTYFNQFVGFTQAHAAEMSALFPLIGVVSVLLCGWISDRLGASGRAVVMFAGLIVATVALFLLTSVAGGGAGTWAVTLVGLVGLGLLGPYSYLAGAMAMDFGGRQGGALSSGFIDGIGYIGGFLAGDSVARISVAFGWQKAFLALSGVCLLSALAAAALFLAQRRRVIIDVVSRAQL